MLVQDDKHFYADYCNEEGVITIEENRSFDAVTFSCVGYKDKTITKEKLKKSVVYLTPESYQLDEVVITNKKVIDTLLLGELKEKKKGVLPLYIQNEVAVFFKNDFERDVALKTFLFKTWRIKYKTAIRLRLYKKRIFKTYHLSPNDPEKKKNYYNTVIPGEDLLGENIIIYLDPQKKEIIEVDFSQYNIPIPKGGVFISVECLGYYDENGNAINPDKNKLSELEMHTTTVDNYCIKYTNITRFWVNENQHYKIDYKYINNKEAPRNVLRSPTFGLKVVRLE
ncbi:hypothetical protein GCM10007424_06800 [Flavobacterium suaedae]|uniref:Carboxypeptidase-like regulatory domain-containing protein n=1 Tax=Flavobacterium suaedae TaxID=1767027 RepID=A0ABQ1JLT6_9FLAO|nr:hypothetical protein GCM10007424_06800 [Flavobacterium suaedae]